MGLVIPVISYLSNQSHTGDNIITSVLLNFDLRPSNEDIALIFFSILVLVYLIKSFFMSYLAWYQAKFTYGLQADLSHKLLKEYLLRPYAFHVNNNHSRLSHNVIAEVELFSSVVNTAINLSAEILIISGISIFLFIYQIVATSAIAAILFVIVLSYIKLTRTMIVRLGEKRHLYEVLKTERANQALLCIKDVKIFSKEKFFLADYHKYNEASADAVKKHAILQQLPRFFLEFIAIASLSFGLLVMTKNGMKLNSILPLLGLYAAASFRLLPSVNRIITGIQTLRYASVVTDKLYKEISEADKFSVETHVNSYRLERLSFEKIQLKNISYDYLGSNTNSIDDVSLNITKGESIGIIGSSGSGKSTLIDIILGLLTPKNGVIEVDCKDIQKFLPEWRAEIGYIPQHINLIDDTVARNVAFGIPDEDIDQKKLIKAIEGADLLDWVSKLPNKLNTEVGDRGVRISGGQKQRIGIARALYNDPQILLLDEATSALDNNTETRIINMVNKYKGQKTLIFVAHRMTTVKNCDYLYKLEYGRLVSEGTPIQILGE